MALGHPGVCPSLEDPSPSEWYSGEMREELGPCAGWSNSWEHGTPWLWLWSLEDLVATGTGSLWDSPFSCYAGDACGEADRGRSAEF